MKTFDEDFNYFKQNCTFKKIFLKETFSHQKKEWLLLIPLTSVVAGYILLFCNYITAGLILTISGLMVFFYYMIKKTKQAKKRTEKE